MRRFLGCAAIVVAGCNGSSSDAPAGAVRAGATCGEATSVSLAIGLKRSGKTMPELASAQQVALTSIGAVMTRHCTADTWAPATITCFAGSKSAADLGTCDKLLTPAQRAGMDAAMKELGPPPPVVRRERDVGSGSGSAAGPTP